MGWFGSGSLKRCAVSATALQRSVEYMQKQFDRTYVVLSCIPPDVLLELLNSHGEVHVSEGSMSLACISNKMHKLPAVMMACPKLKCYEACLVAGHLHTGPSEVLQLLQPMMCGKDLLFKSMTGPPSAPSCSTSLAVINNEHQTQFADHCKKRLACLRQVVALLPECTRVDCRPCLQV